MRRRTIKKQLWLNSDEDKILKQKSKATGLSESELIRSFIKGYHIKEQPTDVIKQFQRELSGIANNINQMARIANTYQFVNLMDYEQVTEELSSIIMRLEKKLYSRGD